MHGPLEVSENEIPVLESCELSRNEPVQSLDLHIAECRIEMQNTNTKRKYITQIVNIVTFEGKATPVPVQNAREQNLGRL